MRRLLLPLSPGLLVSLSVLPGCTVGPDFESPRTHTPDRWLGIGGSATQPSTPQEAAADVARWWTAFNDPVLDSLVGRAAEANLDLQIAGSRVRQARATRGITASGLYPSIDTSGSYRHSGVGPTDEVVIRQTGQDANGDGIPDTVTTRSNGSGAERDLYQVGLDASWEIDVFGGVRRSVEAADADIRAAVWDYRDVMVTLVSEVGLTYIDLRSLQRQLAIAQKNLDLQKQTADLTRRRFAGGFVSGLDVANADAIVAETASRIPSLEAAARQDVFALSVLLGQEPGALVDELATTAPIPTTPPDVPAGLPSDLLERRPDLRRAEEDLHAATARVGAAEADLFPRFSLTGSFNLSNERANRLFNWDNRTWAFGPAISWPLFDAGRIRSNINVQKESQFQALLTYRARVLVALQDVENALVAYVNEQQRRKFLVDSATANRKAFDLASQLYQLGQTDFLNVLSAQRSLLASEDALAQSDRTVATNLIAIYKALGGGWEETPPGATTQPAATQPATRPAAAAAATQPMR